MDVNLILDEIKFRNRGYKMKEGITNMRTTLSLLEKRERFTKANTPVHY